MNLKERGITVGDLLIIIIILISTALFIKNIKKDNQTTLNVIEPNLIDTRNIGSLLFELL